jgi:hypothetical protein
MRDWVTRVTVIHGSTSSRKTDTARRLLARKGGVYFKSPGSGKWFDGYSGEPCVVIDECHGGKDGLPFNMLMFLLNCEPTQVEEKGSVLPWAPKWLIMTTTTPLLDWYQHLDKNHMPPQMVKHHRIEELMRRIEHKIENVTSYADLKNRFKNGDKFKEITADPTPMDTDFDDSSTFEATALKSILQLL